MDIESQIVDWAELVAASAKSVPLQRAFDTHWSKLDPVLTAGVPHRRLAEALARAGVSAGGQPMSTGYVSAAISRSRRRERDREWQAASSLAQLQSALDNAQNLTMLAGRNSNEVEMYIAAIADEEEFAIDLAENLEKIKEITAHGSFLGAYWSVRRLYYSLRLKEILEEQIKEMTRPRLADLVRIDLPKLANLPPRKTNIVSSDGQLYVRKADKNRRYLEIGSPDGADSNTSPEWLSDVLAGIESCSRLFERIVMTDPYDSHGDEELLEVYSKRGWRDVGGNLEYSIREVGETAESK